MEGNRPRGREQNITGKGKDVYIHGEGLGTGPVGNSGGYQGRPGAQKPASRVEAERDLVDMTKQGLRTAFIVKIDKDHAIVPPHRQRG